MTDKSSNGKENKRPATRIPEIVSDPSVRAYIRTYYKELGKDHYPDIAMARWKNGTHYPPVDVLIGIATILKTNLSYVLGLTDVNAPCDFTTEPKERTLHDLMETRKMNMRELASGMNFNYKSLHNFETELPRKRVYSLMMLSEAINLSADYILGYTDWETWEMYSQLSKPFSNVKAGSAAYIVADKDSRSIKDIESAIERGDGQYCLITTDGRFVLFPNGNKISIRDEMFKGAFVINVRPEVPE